MKYITIITLLFAQISICFAQNFEGKLVYDVHFEINEKALKEMNISKEDMIKRRKADGNHYDEITIYLRKNGDYIKENNSKPALKAIYQSSSNKFFVFKEKSKYIAVGNANKNLSAYSSLSDAKPVITKIDSTKIILGDTCKLVVVDWGEMGIEHYWYSDKFQLDAELFTLHKYQYLNRVLELTNAYPIEHELVLSGSIAVTITLRSYEEIDLSDEIFALPKMKKSKRKKHKRTEEITGNKIMKIKSRQKTNHQFTNR